MKTGISVQRSALGSARGVAGALRTSRLALVLGAAVGLSACGKESDAAKTDTANYVQVGAENVMVVGAEEVSTGPLISGSLKAEGEAVVRAETGGSVIAVAAERGQAVRAGQVLARIEASAQQGALISARSAVRSAQRALEVAQRDAERYESLGQAGAVAERDVEVARNGVEAARAQLDGARAQLANAQQQVANTQVRSPISGVVSDRPVNAGDVVAPGAALFTIINPSSMRLEASVPSESLGQVRPGMAVEFTINGYPGRTFTGHIERINPAADPATRQVPIFVAIPNAGGTLVSGLFAQGRVATQARQALAVPASAVDQSAGAPTVLRVRRGVTERVPVQLGLTDSRSERVEIVSGLAPGDTVLTGAAVSISPKTPVRVGASATTR